MRFLAEEHLPRPDFDCREGCGKWPCAIGREQIRETGLFMPKTLSLFLVDQMEKATAAGVEGDLRARFVGWLPNPERVL